MLIEAIKRIDLDYPKIDYDVFINLLRAICAACGGSMDVLTQVVWPWVCTQKIARGQSGLRSEDRGIEWLEARWRSFTDSQLGAEYVYGWAASFGFTEAINQATADRVKDIFDGYTDGGSKEVVDGLMSTGDVGHFDSEGRLFVDGRDDDMIVSGGENVFPREVEDLMAEHPACEEVSVVGRSDDEFGQRLTAFVVLRPGQHASEEELKAYVGSHLARYKVPRRVEFLDRLPRSTTGKVLKRELPSDDKGDPTGSNG